MGLFKLFGKKPSAESATPTTQAAAEETKKDEELPEDQEAETVVTEPEEDPEKKPEEEPKDEAPPEKKDEEEEEETPVAASASLDIVALSAILGADKAVAAAKASLTLVAALEAEISDLRAQLKTQADFIKSQQVDGSKEAVNTLDKTQVKSGPADTLGANLSQTAKGFAQKMPKKR